MPKAKAPITPYQNLYKFAKIPVINTRNANALTGSDGYNAF